MLAILGDHGSIMRNQERRSNLRRSSSSTSSSSECSRQRYNLDRFSLLPVSCCVWDTGFRIDNRTIKRGSRMSNSVTLFREISNLCILASSYLVAIWSYPCEDLELVLISI